MTLKRTMIYVNTRKVNTKANPVFPKNNCKYSLISTPIIPAKRINLLGINPREIENQSIISMPQFQVLNVFLTGTLNKLYKPVKNSSMGSINAANPKPL